MRAHTLAFALLLTLATVAAVPTASAATEALLPSCYGVVIQSSFTGLCLQGCSGPNGPGTAIYQNGRQTGCIY